ncbi:MAG TPA: metallopeptidase family protein [Ktedonobacteraceae bacterium]|nr:metallopeptidase family protein [Ktedonobacteraceae bacterium]
MKQVQRNDFTGSEADKARGERGAYTFFALLCFLVAIIFLSIFLGNALDGFSSMLVLLGVIAFGLGGVYLLGQRPAQKSQDEHIFQPDTYQDEYDTGERVVEGTLVASSLAGDEFDDDEALDGEEDEQSLNAFKMLVEEALDSIPPEFRRRMDNLVVLVEREPARAVLQRVGTREGYTLLGLYEGTPLTAQGHQGTLLPERITIYQRTIEAYCHGDAERIRQQVRATLLHEVAHHFGLDHDAMPIWVK